MPDAPTTEIHYCYRHPDRETLLSCSVCERPICTQCMNPAPVGIRCPECASGGGSNRSAATSRPARTRVARTLARPGRHNTVTITLVVINLIVFLAEVAQGLSIMGGGAVPEIILRGGLYGPSVANGETWRLVTSAFIHESIIHVGFNMWALWILGTAFESYVGARRMIIVYGVSLFWGAAGALLLSPGELTIGASGAIFGIMGAMVVMFRQRGIAIMESGLGILILLNLAFTLFIPGVSIGGHIGGLIGGALCGYVLSGYGRGHIAYGRFSSAIAGGVAALLIIAIVLSLYAAHAGV